MGRQATNEGARPRVKARKEPRTTRSYWREHVLAQSEYLRALLVTRRRWAAPRRLAELPTEIEALLDQARRCAGERKPTSTYRPRRLMDIWSGAAVEGAYLRLHNADALLVALLSRNEIRAAGGALLKELRQTRSSDPRLASAEQELESALRPATSLRPQQRRAAYHRALVAKHAVLDEQHARVRSFRNVIMVAAVSLTLIGLGLIAVAVIEPTVLSLCFEPSGKPVACPSGREQPSSWDVPLVMFLGLAGGALASAVAIRNVRGSSTPYMVPLSLAALKLPAGALTSLLGLILLKGEFVPGFSAVDVQAQVLAYAIVLGYAQQLATRLVDRQAHDVLDRVPSTDPTPTSRSTVNTPTPGITIPGAASPSDQPVAGR
jgi:hypothetical protein